MGFLHSTSSQSLLPPHTAEKGGEEKGMRREREKGNKGMTTVVPLGTRRFVLSHLPLLAYIIAVEVSGWNLILAFSCPLFHFFALGRKCTYAQRKSSSPKSLPTSMRCDRGAPHPVLYLILCLVPDTFPGTQYQIFRYHHTQIQVHMSQDLNEGIAE